jgi:hypothetical protein
MAQDFNRGVGNLACYFACLYVHGCIMLGHGVVDSVHGYSLVLHCADVNAGHYRSMPRYLDISVLV